ncbi:hypothetical protein D3C71_1572400 [compost metagenome]
MQQQRVAALHVLLVDLQHQHVVGVLLDEGAVGVQLHHPVRLAQVAVGVVLVLHHEARVILAAHRVVVGAAEQVGHGGGELDHVLGLLDRIQPFRGDQQGPGITVGQGVDQQRLQGVGAQLVEQARAAKAQERLVLQGLHRVFGDRGEEGLDDALREGQLQQARRIRRRRQAEALRLERLDDGRLELDNAGHGGRSWTRRQLNETFLFNVGVN